MMYHEISTVPWSVVTCLFFFHLLGDAHRYNKESLMVGWLQPITPWWRSYGFLWDAHRTYRQHYDMLLRTSLNMVRIPDTFLWPVKHREHLIFLSSGSRVSDIDIDDPMLGGLIGLLMVFWLHKCSIRRMVYFFFVLPAPFFWEITMTKGLWLWYVATRWCPIVS